MSKKKKDQKFGLRQLEKEQLLNVSVVYSDHLDDYGHISVTRWGNREGFNIEVSSGGGSGGCDFHFAMTDMQWRGLRRIMRAILAREKSIERRRIQRTKRN